MDEFTMHVMKHKNGCRIDLTYPIIQHIRPEDMEPQIPTEATEYYSADGNVIAFQLDFNGDDIPTVAFTKGAPPPAKESSPTEDDIPF